MKLPPRKVSIALTAVVALAAGCGDNAKSPDQNDHGAMIVNAPAGAIVRVEIDEAGNIISAPELRSVAAIGDEGDLQNAFEAAAPSAVIAGVSELDQGSSQQAWTQFDATAPQCDDDEGTCLTGDTTGQTPQQDQKPSQTQAPLPKQAPTQSPKQGPTQSPKQAPAPVPTQSPKQAPAPVPTQSPKQAPAPVPTQSPKQAPTQAPKVDVVQQTPKQAPTQSPKQGPVQSPKQGPVQSPKQGPVQSPSQQNLVADCGEDYSYNDTECLTDHNFWSGYYRPVYYGVGGRYGYRYGRYGVYGRHAYYYYRPYRPYRVW